MTDEKGGPPDRKPRIRPISRITQSKYNLLKQLNCFPEIDRRLRLGWSPDDCARAIQEEFKEFRDTSHRYLKKLLARYLGQIPAAELSAQSANSLVSRKATKILAEGLNELEELERLYRRQEARLAIDEANEQKINKLLPGTANEFIVAAKILKQSSELKMDLGLIKRQVGSVEVTGSIAADITARLKDDRVGRLVADPEARKRLMSLAEKLVAFGAKTGGDPEQVLRQIPAPQDDELNEDKIIDITPDAKEVVGTPDEEGPDGH